MKRIALAVSLASLIFALSGCWNSVELNELAIVVGLGIDSTDDGEYMVTAQVARPQLLKDGNTGGDAYFNVSHKGKAVFSALKDLMGMFSRTMYTQQCEVLIIGEETAKDDVSALLEYFLRNVESRMTMPILISRGKAIEVFKQATYLESMSAIQLAKMAKNQQFAGLTDHNTVFTFISDLTSECRQPTAPIVELFQDDSGTVKARISGTAIFKDARMVGEFGEEEVYGLRLINNDLHSGIMQITGLGGLIELEIMRCTSRVKPVVSDGKVSVDIRVDIECDLISTTSHQHINDSEKILEVEELAREEVIARINSALAAARAFNSDVFGFGQRVYQRYPKLYAEIENGDGGWDAVFQTLPVVVSANVKLMSIGSSMQPVTSGSGD
ncbi:MAG: Ger(x)C family spore germination protein [Oscillospiraceae bacterium]|jgi:Ger(x)C family germination protein|nr:Ger(x)C family spore germination protein [Oscillospiraceae bacterium]